MKITASQRGNSRICVMAMLCDRRTVRSVTGYRLAPASIHLYALVFPSINPSVTGPQKYNTRGIYEMTERRDVIMYNRCHFFLPFLSFRLLPRPAAGTDAAKLSPRRTKMIMVNRGQYSQNFSVFFPSDGDIPMTGKSHLWLGNLCSIFHQDR